MPCHAMPCDAVIACVSVFDKFALLLYACMRVYNKTTRTALYECCIAYVHAYMYPYGEK